MRIGLAQALADRIATVAAQDGSALALWATTWEVSLPRTMVGYERPAAAQSWPFVSLVPVGGVWDVIRNRLDDAQIALVCGALDAAPRGDGARGVRMVDDLEAAVVAALTAQGVVYDAGAGLSRQMILSTCRQTDLVATYPHYELESVLSLISV